MATLERVKVENSLLFKNHFARYNFSLQFVKNKRVLDFGCGEGYGTELLDSIADTTSALDFSRTAVNHTSTRVKAHIVQADGRQTPFASDYFDVIVSFEVFEHITNPELYLMEAHRMLKHNGILIMSTPNKNYYPLAGQNPYHVKEYTVEEVTDTISTARLKLDSIYAQISNKPEISRLEKSKLLLFIMKFKRKLGIHHDLLPSYMQKRITNLISKGELGEISPDDYKFVKDKHDEADLIYIAKKI